MEISLILGSSNEKLVLPVPPEEFTIQEGNNNQIVTVENVGELNFFGKPKLISLTLSSFFPSQYYPFCLTKELLKPYGYVELIERWMQAGKPLILNIEKTRFNLTCCIENFSYGERDGSGDVYYTLEFKEYRIINTNVKAAGESSSNLRQQVREPAKTHIVKPGDTLWAIAQKEYGNGSRWKEIASKNGIKDPKRLQPGQRLVL
ncbi:MAG: LysM peptidoglycan-binding domain-containing protein [Bacillota bacterium]